MKLTIYTALLLGLVACTRSEESRPSAEEVSKGSGSQLNASALPSFEEKNFSLEERCTKNGGPGAFENVQRAEEDMKQCLQSPINITDVRAENKKYKSTDNLIITFKNYCNERFIKRSCSDNYTDAMKHCLAKTELENEKIVKLNNSLLDSVCNKLDDYIADFISAEGPECFQSKQEHIQNCFGKTNESDNNLRELDSLPLLIFSKDCGDLIEFNYCVLGVLFQCPDYGRIGSIMNSIFYLITDAMYCIRRVRPSFSILQREDLLLDNFTGAKRKHV